MSSQTGSPRLQHDGASSVYKDSIAPSSTENPVESEVSPLLGNAAVQDQEVRNENDVPYKAIDKRRFWLMFVCVLLVYLLTYIDSTLMASAHPVITSYFNSSNAASWLSTVFLLAMTVSQPVFGRLSDTVGRRPVILFSLSLFVLTTTWCALAQSMGSFIAARGAAGLAAGGSLALSNILMADVVKIEYRGIFQGYISVAYGLGCSLGAAGGGILCDKLGWRAAFGIQIPFILLLLTLAYISVPGDLGPNLAVAEGKTLAEAFKSFDTGGAIALVVAISGLILGINLGGNIFPWSHPVVIISLIVFFVTTCILIYVEGKATRPVLPMSLLSKIPIGALMWSNFLACCVTNTVLFYFPVLIQTVWQRSPTASGLYLLSPLIGLSIASGLTGIYIKRTGKLKPMMAVGVFLFLVGAAGIACLSIPGVPTWSIILLNPWTSIAQGLHFPATTVSVLALTTVEEQAVVTTTLGLMRNLGSVMGVAMSSLIFQNLLLSYLERNVVADAPTKRHIIDSVRKSIKSIGGLEPLYKAEVLAAYAQALRITFLCAAAFAGLIICLILPLRIPRLPEHQDAEDAGKPTITEEPHSTD